MNNWKEQFIALTKGEYFKTEIKNVNSLYVVRQRLSWTNDDLLFKIERNNQTKLVQITRVK